MYVSELIALLIANNNNYYSRIEFECTAFFHEKLKIPSIDSN